MRILSSTLLSISLLAGATPLVAETVKPLKLVVILQWEGRDLQAHNLEALQAFRRVFSDISFVHLLSPAYFLRPSEDPAVAQAKIRALMKPKDQLGVVLAGWKSLVTKAGLIYRNGPTFWGQNSVPTACDVDCGLDVPINVYPAKGLEALVQTAATTLESQGFGRPRGMITEGWVASPEVLEAAAHAGIRYDFSAVAPEMLALKARHFPLFQWAKNLWPQVTPHTQPFVIPTSRSSLREIPQSLAALDYTTADEVLTLFREYTDVLKKNPDTELTFPLVIYQETAAVTLPALAKVLQGIFAYAHSEGLAIEQLELPGLELPGALVAGRTDGGPTTFNFPGDDSGSRAMHEPMVH